MRSEELRDIVRRARVIEVDDSGTQQLADLSGLRNDKPKKIVRVQQHGFSSNPPADSELVILALGGGLDRGMAIGGESKDHRPKNLPPGGVAIYDADGKILKIVKDETTYDAGNKPVTVQNATVIKLRGAERVSIGLNGVWINIIDDKVHLGVATPDATATNAVVTEAGPSSKVFAAI